MDDPRVEEVVALDRVAWRGAHAKVRFLRGDIRDPDLAGHLRGCEALAHLAFVVETGARDEADVESINVGGTQNVFRAAAEAGVRQVVYTSSIASYGFHADNADAVLTEESPLRGNAEFYYSRTKATVERWLDGFEAEFPDVAVCRLRPTSFLAEGTRRALAGPIHGLLIPLIRGGPDVPIHMTHQEDVVSALVLCLEKNARGAYNLGSDEPLPMSRWGAALGRRSVTVPAFTQRLLVWAYSLRLIDVGPDWFELAGQHPIVVSSEKIKRELGWRPVYPTTAVVLRAVAGRQAVLAGKAPGLFLGSLARVTRWRGHVVTSEQEAYELRAITGTMNMRLTGERPSEWHAVFDGGRIGYRAGLAPCPEATVSLTDATFCDLLAGKTSVSAAQLTGKVRYQGDGDFVFSFGALLQRFKDLAEGKLLERLFHGAVLKRTRN